MKSGIEKPTRQRPLRTPSIAAEGQDGLFTQSWFAVCLSSQARPGAIHSTEFLSGKVIVIRRGDGKPQVLSAYCLHMGADLSVAKLVDGQVRCPFHHWRYNDDGKCVRTGIGDPAPGRAQLFQFPTEERCGVIFAFNGETPLYPLPDPFAPYAEDELAWAVIKDPRGPWPVDPWVVRANTPDWQHFAFVHNMNWNESQRPTADSYRWGDYTVSLDTAVSLKEQPASSLEYHIQITGTSLWHHQGTLNGRWHMSMSALALPRAGWCDHYFVCAVRKGTTDEDRRAADAFLKELLDVFEKMLDEDDVILRGLRYKPGLLTEADAALARYLQYVERFPRANPARDFIC